MSDAVTTLGQTDAVVIETVNQLVDRAMGAGGNEPDRKAGDELLELFRAAESAGDLRVVQAMTSKESQASIFWAAEHGHMDVLKALLAAGVDPKLNGMANFHPINAAMRKNQADVIELLVAAGEDPNYAGFLGKSLLIYAAEDHRFEALRALLRLGADPNHRDMTTGRTPLIAGAAKMDGEFVRFAVKWGADVNSADDNGRTALLEACAAGNAAAVPELIVAGADVNHVSRLRPIEQIEAEGRSNPMFSSGIWRKLRKLEQDPQETALMLAAKNGRAEIVKMLLDAGADAQPRDKARVSAYEWATRRRHKPVAELLRSRSNSGPVLCDLLRAADDGDIDAVRAALAAGLDINGKDPVAFIVEGNTIDVLGGKTALIHAAENNDVEMIQELLSRGADVNAMGDKSNVSIGQSPLIAAAENGFIDVVRVLIAAGANVKAKELASSGVPAKTALQRAIDNGHREVVDALIKAGAKARGKGAVAGLHEAVEKGDVEIVRKLLATGPKVNAFAKGATWTPLIMACAYGRAEIVSMLLAAGADVNLAGKNGQTPLTAAVEGTRSGLEIVDPDQDRRDYEKTITLLLEAGADVNVTSWRQQTPLDLAVSNGHSAMAKLLTAAGGKRSSEIAEQTPSWEPPDFSEAEKSDTFRRAVSEFTERLGEPEEDYGETEFGRFFRTTHGQARRIVADEQAKWQEQGVFVFRTAPFLPHDDADEEYIGLFATSDKYEALAAMETAGASERGTAAVIAALRQIERQDPFIIHFCSEDIVDGEFAANLSAPGKVAKQVYEICSDIVSQGTGTVAELAKSLRSGRRLFLWWD